MQICTEPKVSSVPDYCAVSQHHLANICHSPVKSKHINTHKHLKVLPSFAETLNGSYYGFRTFPVKQLLKNQNCTLPSAVG